MEKLTSNVLTSLPPNRPRGEVVSQKVSGSAQAPIVSSPENTVSPVVSQVRPAVAQPPLEAEPQLPVQEQPEAAGALSPQEKEALASSAEKLNDAAAIAQRSIQFDVHEETGRTIITVSDKETGEQIRTIPPETLLRVAEHIEDVLADKTDALRGLLINHEV